MNFQLTFEWHGVGELRTICVELQIRISMQTSCNIVTLVIESMVSSVFPFAVRSVAVAKSVKALDFASRDLSQI
jgi:hypothetical protein